MTKYSQNTLELFTTYCHSWAHGWETFSDAECFILKEFDERGHWESKCQVCLAFERRGEGRAGLGQLLPPPFCPASAPAELDMHRRNQKNRVESWLCHLLPVWLWVSYLISLVSNFQNRVVVRIEEYDW